LIVVDRWLFLREHGDVVSECWVEPVFDYGLSPRNLVVVGIKRALREGYNYIPATGARQRS
jgi:hypothetical protein